jgi:3alpha(or 20beta)-hydroxysteroid dehydrogenase
MGAATARLFGQEGAKVVIADVQTIHGQTLAGEIGANALFCQLDVSSEQDWEQAMSATAERFGGVDILINNAGIVVPKDILDETKAGFERTLSINLTGCFLGIRHVAPSMIKKGKGSIVNISSAEGFRGTNHMIAYSASKWGVRGLSRAAAMELGRRGIRVNSVHPGPTDTDMSRPFLDFDGPIGDVPMFKQMLNRQPINRFASPTEIARVNLFLAGDDSSFVTGAEIAADGGMVCGAFSDYADEGITEMAE